MIQNAIAGVLVAVAALVLWWVNTYHTRRRDKLMEEGKKLVEEYNAALARKDSIAVARIHKRMREFETRTGYRIT